MKPLKYAFKPTGLALAPFLFTLCLTPSESTATIIQVLHTNDLHASLDTYGAPRESQPEYGGWSQIKTVMNRLTEEAKNKGIETLKLDAGDFSEGTSDYFADYSTNVLKAFQNFGYDAAALGNHDWMLGARGMNIAYGRAPFPFPVLAANVHIARKLWNIKSQIIPSTVVTKDGIRIGILGLTTNEAFYKWIPRVASKRRELKIKNMWIAARNEARKLKNRSDVVIALTHIGAGRDKMLATKTDNIDVIVGGHSHTVLDALAFSKNPSGKEVPIVQAGYNGRYIGRFYLEVNPGETPRVLSYELVPVNHTEAKDPEMEALVQKAHVQTQNLFGKETFEKPIGQSKTRLVPGTSGPTAFSQFAVNSIYESGDSNFSLDVGALHGNTVLPAGTVTRKSFIEMYPRKFESWKNEGWMIYKAWVPGWLIKFGIRYAVKYGFFISMGGVKYDVVQLTDEEYDARVKRAKAQNKSTQMSHYKAINIRMTDDQPRPLRMAPILSKEELRDLETDQDTTDQDTTIEQDETPLLTPDLAESKLLTSNGQSQNESQNEICNFCWYSVSAPEGLIRGAYGVTKLTHLIIRKGHSIGVSLWDSFQAHLAKIGVIQPIEPEDINGRVYDIRSNPKDNSGGAPQKPWSDSLGQKTDLYTSVTQLSDEEFDQDVLKLPWLLPESNPMEIFENFMSDVNSLNKETSATKAVSTLEEATE